MAGLKPNEEVMTSAAVLAVVYGIFQMQAPTLADVKASSPGNGIVHSSVKGAAAEATAVVAAISLLAKSPTIFVTGGLATAVLSWHYYHANSQNPATGQTVVTGGGNGNGTMQ
jgi:hypothetical protein